MVAKELESRIRDALNQRGNPFEGGARMTPGSSSVQRPLLCLFDRNFDLTAMLQHAWTYQPLVHDVLNMRLNRVDVDTDGSASAATAVQAEELHARAAQIRFGLKTRMRRFQRLRRRSRRSWPSTRKRSSV